MATAAQFTTTPNTGIVFISTQNLLRDGGGSMGTVLTAGANGSRIDKLFIVAQSVTTSGMIRYFINDGANNRLWKEVSVAPTPSSGAAASFNSTLSSDRDVELPLTLPTGYLLKVSTNNAEPFIVTAVGGDF